RASSAPRPAATAPCTPMVADNPNATGPHQGAYQHGVVVRNPAPAPYATVRAPSPAVTIRAPSPTPATIRAPAPSASPAAAPFQPARVSAFAPPTPAAVAKELEQKLFVTETALAPTQAGQLEEEKAPEVDLAPVSKKGLAHPARPGAGTVGKKVMIRANHFLVNVADNNLFHYDVSINPESKSRAVNREVLSELIKLHGKTSLGGKLPAYDGRKSLYTAGSLPFESEEFSVTLVDPEKKDKEKAEREYKITILIAGRTDLYHLQQFLKGRQRDMPQETIQVLDVVLRESPSWNYVTVSRSFFSTTFGHRGDIGEGLECWRGYYQSLCPTQMGLSLNIDISATSFFKPVTVVQFVLEFLNLRDASRPLTDRDRVKIKKALRGVRVETNHQEDQIRRYKITGITPVPMSQLTFPVDERGTRMSVVQYFMQRYKYNLQYTSWPCLQSGSDARPVYLPMEACKIVEGQRYSKKLNDKQVTNILRATCQRPQQREQSIREMVLHNKYAEDKFAQEFGINVCSDLVSVPARVLPPPMLRYHDSGKEKTCVPSVGQWNMINKVGRPPSIEKAFTRFGVPALKNIPTIIFGADVTPPPPGEDSASSVAAVVASMDWPEITKYSGLVSAQPHRQEIIENLFSVTKDPQRGNVNGGMIRELLIAFRRKTGRRPERILFYRDGVSEGQFSHVLLHEMDAIRKACASLEEGYQPEVNFVPVEKKHYTRLLSGDHGRHDMTDKSGNKLSGLVTAHENNGQHIPIDISIVSQAGRLVVQFPFNSTCYSLKTAIEKKLNVSINSCSLYLARKPIDYGKTLAYYGLRDKSVLRMEAKLLGGASIGVPQTVAQTFSDQTLKEYSADSTKFFRTVSVRDKDRPGRRRRITVFNKNGNILGLSVVDQLKKAIKNKKSWNGQLKKEDFRVVDGRAVIIKEPIYGINAVNLPKDCKKILKILKKIFKTEINGADAPFLRWNPFLTDLLTVLESAAFSDLYWLVPFIKTNFAFKTPIQRGNASYNIIRYYEGLNGLDKFVFEAIVNGVPVPTDWLSLKLQTHYFFRKTIQYALNKYGFTYSLTSFGCFKFQRNKTTHDGIVSPWHLSDHEISMLLRSFVAEVVRELLKQRVPIKKALQ
uniref:Piwi domain-containing protein n=2 Tax=Aegilops tauschii subsp. strangulata TaxID=200361 RepID=A0A453KNM1_AEGTS